MPNSPRDQIGVWVLDPVPTLLGVGSLKTKEPKAARGMYLFASWKTQLPLPDGLLLMVKGNLALCRIQHLVLTLIFYANKVPE